MQERAGKAESCLTCPEGTAGECNHLPLFNELHPILKQTCHSALTKGPTLANPETPGDGMTLREKVFFFAYKPKNIKNTLKVV